MLSEVQFEELQLAEINFLNKNNNDLTNFSQEEVVSFLITITDFFRSDFENVRLAAINFLNNIDFASFHSNDDFDIRDVIIIMMKKLTNINFEDVQLAIINFIGKFGVSNFSNEQLLQIIKLFDTEYIGALDNISVAVAVLNFLNTIDLANFSEEEALYINNLIAKFNYINRMNPAA
jgi:hypothetical protein